MVSVLQGRFLTGGTWGSYKEEQNVQQHKKNKTTNTHNWKGSWGPIRESTSNKEKEKRVDESDGSNIFFNAPVVDPYIVPTCKNEDAEAAVTR